MFPDAFLAQYAAHFDFAKSAKFGVLIYQPSGLVAGGLLGGLIGQTKLTRFLMEPLNTAGLLLQCESAVLPGYSINTVEQKVFGAPFTIAATPEPYQPLELSFICAGDLWERKFFEDWMEFILPKGSGRASADTNVGLNPTLAGFLVDAAGDNRSPGSASYRSDYISTIQVINFHDTGVPSARYTFEEVYPVSVAPTPLNWGDDSIQRVTVTFKYTTWSREKNIAQQIFDQFTKPGGNVSVGELGPTTDVFGNIIG